ncbi:unnamed protein product [Ilex paraguariensis]|uniref:Pentatricopeptide repeat-containing protein n=1 Tax=Ilex paraguariensis TaxID=185542 RepID=A0ABC8TWK6_9AQUA
MEYYTCIVDLLGRMGRLDDALEFARKMPLEPNEMVWQGQLGGCRIDGNVEFGELLRRFFPFNQSILPPMFFYPTHTWKQEGKVQKFYARDKQHPRKDDIYLMLEELREEIKAIGYIPDLSDALLDHD